MADVISHLVAEARDLVESGYPIPHDEGCYLDPEYGESTFEGFLDDQELIDGIDNFDVKNYKPFCNCGADEMNARANRFLAEVDNATA